MGADAPIPPFVISAAAPKGAPRRPQLPYKSKHSVICPTVPRRGPEAGSPRKFLICAPVRSQGRLFNSQLLFYFFRVARFSILPLALFDLGRKILTDQDLCRGLVTQEAGFIIRNKRFPGYILQIKVRLKFQNRRTMKKFQARFD